MFWRVQDGKPLGLAVPEDFFHGVDEITAAIDLAIARKLKVMIGQMDMPVFLTIGYLAGC